MNLNHLLVLRSQISFHFHVIWTFLLPAIWFPSREVIAVIFYFFLISTKTFQPVNWRVYYCVVYFSPLVLMPLVGLYSGRFHMWEVWGYPVGSKSREGMLQGWVEAQSRTLLQTAWCMTFKLPVPQFLNCKMEIKGSIYFSGLLWINVLAFEHTSTY